MGRTKEFSEDIEKQAIYNYIEKRQGLQTAGKDFGISQYMMEKILKKYQIQKRTYTEAKQQGRKYPCNDDFFKVQSADMAYILGLIAADGYISAKENCISIELQQQDKEILNKIAKITEVTRPIQIQQRNTGKYTATLRNWSAAWKQDLSHYGITNKKTFTLKPPTLLLPQYRIDYIRGYFDGDGSISTSHTKNSKGIEYDKNSFEIVGASKQEIDWIRTELINHYCIILNKPSQYITNTNTVIYKIITTNKDQIQKIYNLFYNTESNLYLQRKKEKFETILNIPRDSNSLVKE
jgi:hypothetical protein